jgi:hypothetical protein
MRRSNPGLRLDAWGTQWRFVERMAQGGHGGVREDVSASGLTGSRAQSAVFLVHAESPRQAQGSQVQHSAAERLA